jgi:hypothetical protein
MKAPELFVLAARDALLSSPGCPTLSPDPPAIYLLAVSTLPMPCVDEGSGGDMLRATLEHL